MKAIAAMDANRGIGYKGKIPWRIPADFKWFKEFTWGKTLIMGRVTFESLPPLKNRSIVVLTNNISRGENLVQYHMKHRNKCKNLYIRDSQTFDFMEFPDAILAGGARTYLTFLPLCDEIYMSHVMDEYECDTYMPEFENQFPNSEVVREHKDFWVVRYWK
jgi:dihydrofolate reductase